MHNVIKASNVCKSYGQKKAIDGLSLKVSHGTIFGLLGPNGAGKTTFIKVLLDLIPLNDGKISINDVDYKNEESRQGIAYLPEKFNYFPYYTVKGVITFFGKLYGLTSLEIKEKLPQVLEKVGLNDYAKNKLKNLSKGQLQRVGLAKLLISPANIYILDEPFSGLDPLGIREFKNIFLELKKKGQTLFINSHILSEVEQICDDICILYEGKVLAQGPLNELKKEQGLEEFFYDTVQNAKNLRQVNVKESL